MTHKAPAPSRLDRLTAHAPHAAVVGTVGLAVASAITVSLGAHRWWLTLPLAALASAALWWATRPSSPVTSAHVRGARLALAWAAAWIIVGMLFTSEYVVVSRDPGFLSLTGIWLMDHPSTDIPTAGTIPAAALQSNLLADAWQAWNLEGDVIQPQGAKLLPAMLAIGGWIAGLPGLFGVNVIVGGVGLLAVYGLARRVLEPMQALLAPVALGLTVAHLGLSRSPYSEPITLVLLMAAVLWAAQGIEERRLAPLAAAGLASGATAFARIDGAAYALGVLAGVAIAAALAGRWGTRAVFAFAIPQALAVAGGYASLTRWSAAYVERLGSEAHNLEVGYAAVTGAVAATSIVAPLVVARLRPYLVGHRNSLAQIAAALTMTALVVLAARPLFMDDRRGTESTTDQFTNRVTESFQSAEGYPVDGTRTYAEYTVSWLAYYFTWPVIAIAAVGFAVLAYVALARRPAILTLLGAVAVPTLLYLIRPAVVPDQIWAIRRFEPATIPGIAIAAAVGLWWLTARARVMWPAYHHRIVAAGALLLVLAPVSTWLSVRLGDSLPVAGVPYVATKEQRGALAESDALCAAIAGRPTVLVSTSSNFGTIRVMCDVPVVLALVPPEQETLAQMRDLMGGDLVVVTRNPEMVWEEAPDPFYSGTLTSGEYGLQHLPRKIATAQREWYAGVVEADGTVTAITAGQTEPEPTP